MFRLHLRDHLAAALLKAAVRLSPDEARRFIAEVNQQAQPQSSREDLLLAFLQGGIPAVIHKLS